MIYFIVCIEPHGNGRPRCYREYIREVEPIVRRFGGKYIVRSDKIISLSERWKPERVIVIQWDTREQMERCFASEEYQSIAGKREGQVDSRAIIVEE